jgi:transposase InsO family protein
VSRAGLYRYDPMAETPDDDLDLRDDIQRIALEYPYYGRPRITAELKRRGWEVNHKRVGRIMREDNLLCLRRRRFVVTTDSNHSFRVYPNLARNMELTGIDQLWRADITYIRLETEFVHPPLSARAGAGYRSCRKEHALPIVRDEFRPAIPRRGARQRCPSPLHRHHQLKTIAPKKGMIYHRTIPVS